MQRNMFIVIVSVLYLAIRAEVFLRLSPVRISMGERDMHAIVHDGV